MQNKLQLAYQQGRKYVEEGANTANCHFSIFATLDQAKAWELGKRAAAQDKIHALADQYNIKITIHEDKGESN